MYARVRGLLWPSVHGWLLAARSRLLCYRAALLGLARRLCRRLLLTSAPPPPAPTFAIGSTKHRRWLQPVLERAGWVGAPPPGASFVWQLSKKLLPRCAGALVHNSLPNLLLLDDKAVLGLLTRGFTRTAIGSTEHFTTACWARSAARSRARTCTCCRWGGASRLVPCRPVALRQWKVPVGRPVAVPLCL